MADISDEPMTQIEAYRLIDGLAKQVNKSLDALAASVNEAIATVFAALDERSAELVAGPTVVKRIQRDASGEMVGIEEYARPVFRRPAESRR